MASTMKWEPIAECPDGEGVLFLFDPDDGKRVIAEPRYAAQGWCKKRFSGYTTPPTLYFIGFEVGAVNVGIRSEIKPIAFARITLPDFLSDEATQ